MGKSEAETMAEVTEHLVRRFPGIPAERVAIVVDSERQRLASGRIRDFLPLLAERAAMQRLQAESLGEAAPRP